MNIKRLRCILRVTKKEFKVVSVAEVVLVMLFAGMALALFFPKDKITAYVAQENNNYALSLTYLQNIASKYPDEAKNWENVIAVLLPMGKLEEAALLFDQHLASDKEQASLGYKIARIQYFESKDNQKDPSKLFVLMQKVLNNQDHAMYEAVLSDAILLGNTSIMIEAMKKSASLKITLSDQEIKRLYNTFIGLGKTEEYLQLMRRMYARTGAQNIALHLAKIYTDLQNHTEASRLYADVYSRGKNRNMFSKAMESLIRAGDTKALLLFVQKYEDDYLLDTDMAIKIIRLYLSNASLQEAKNFTIKQMKKRESL